MRRLLVGVLLATALARFGQVAYRGLTYSIGDFYSTLPGAYVETWNPTLWASGDLTDLVGRGAYHRGPTQYLTTVPLSFLDSYRQIARVLLVVYAAVIGGAAWLMFRIFAADRRDAVLLALVLSSSLLYYPTLQGYLAREFEIAMLGATALLFAAVLGGRQTAAGALAAYLSLYKFLPLALVPYLVARRWWRALAGFAVAAAALLAAAHVMFGLGNFSSDGFVQGFAGSLVASMASTEAFCHGPWDYLRWEASSHDVGVRIGLCGINQAVAIPVVPIYAALIVLTLAALGYGFVQIERHAALDPPAERWRRTLELSAVLIVYTTFFLTHYYYLTFLIVPLTALMVRAYQSKRTGLWLAWAASYVLLSAFLLPHSAMTRWLQTDTWDWYIKSLAYLPGELLLLGTVLVEYVRLGAEASASRPEPIPRD